MQRSSLLRPTFRRKLLLALIGAIAPLLLVTLLVVRREANRQVAILVESTANRAGDLFARIERIRQQQLDQLGFRAGNSNRWAAAMQQALEGDAPFLVDQTLYELEFAGYADALAAFVSLSGEPVAAVMDRAALPNPAEAISTAAVDRLLAGDTAVFGYHLLGGRLFSVHPTVLNLVTEPIGVLQLGFAIDRETAASLGQALGADVCFVAAGRCVASSTGRPIHELEQFARSDHAEVRRHTTDGQPMATVARALPGAADTGMQIVLRISLVEVIRPFASIQRAIRLTGLAVLILAGIIAVLLSRGLAQPVRALVAATVRVARGEYETRVHVKSRDELGMLAAAFNDMTEGLQLKEKYRGVLDKVISRDVADEMLKGEIKLGGETRVVTTLFADVRGYTAMSEGMAPHDVIAVLNEVMERAEAAVGAEGGVVDKYVGDEIMALFGAPMSREHDELRAVRAAVRIQQEVAGMNARRAAAGLAPLTVGIGINTGTVVAGNMGSARRLNYTVLGAPVNLAARLCSEAGRGQILIGQETLKHVREHVQVASLGARTIKGFSSPVEVFELIALKEESVPAGRSPGATITMIALLLAMPTSAALAQRTYTIGPLQIQPSARVDALGFIPASRPAWLIQETAPFVAGRASAFFDVFAGRHVYALAELRLDRGDAPSNHGIDARIEQAFLRLTPFTTNDLSLQLGRFVSPFGNYPQRHHSAADPLIRPPLSYDYRTMVSSMITPGSNDGFLNWKTETSDFRRSVGAPPVWAAPYQLGAMLLGTLGKASFRLALMNSAPSSEPAVWNQWPDVDLVSSVAHLGLQVTPELRIGASFNQGPYIDPAVPLLKNYSQRLVGLETTLTRGPVELRAELLHDSWQVPNVPEGAIDVSYYLEGKLKIGAGLFVAGRFGAIHFNELHYDDGRATPWDFDTRRIQLGGGYRITRAIDVRAEYMVNSSDGPDRSDNLFSVQAAWTIH